MISKGRVANEKRDKELERRGPEDLIEQISVSVVSI